MRLCGVNFGGYLSQVKEFTGEHLDSFITARDVEQVKKWGFNAVRLPVDYFLFEDDDKPFTYREDRVAYIDKMLDWTAANGLWTILDLHIAPGHSFAEQDRSRNDIWDKKARNRKRFLAIWDYFAGRYGKRGDIMYEVLNEPVAPDNAKWLSLAEDAIAVIRGRDTDHYIVVESNLWGQSDTFRGMKKFKDDKIMYSFHSYDPILVTHQMAEWVPFVRNDIYRKYVKYPGKPEGLHDLIKKVEEVDGDFATFLKNQDRDYNAVGMEKVMEPVLRFMEKHGVPVLCGEFGCIAKADPQTRKNWTRDIMGILKKYGISFTYWNYKDKDFGLVDHTDKYKDNPNYANPEREDTGVLKALQDGM